MADAIAKENGYGAVRVLPDGSIAGIVQLMTTWGLMTGMHRDGWTQRFCFRRLDKALEQLYALQSEDDEPVGFVARRPELRDEQGHYIGAVREERT